MRPALSAVCTLPEHRGCRNCDWRMEDRTSWYGSPVAIIYLVLLVTLGIISIRKGHDRWLIRRPWIVG